MKLEDFTSGHYWWKFKEDLDWRDICEIQKTPDGLIVFYGYTGSELHKDLNERDFVGPIPKPKQVN